LKSKKIKIKNKFLVSFSAVISDGGNIKFYHVYPQFTPHYLSQKKIKIILDSSSGDCIKLKP